MTEYQKSWLSFLVFPIFLVAIGLITLKLLLANSFNSYIQHLLSRLVPILIIFLFIGFFSAWHELRTYSYAKEKMQSGTKWKEIRKGVILGALPVNFGCYLLFLVQWIISGKTQVNTLLKISSISIAAGLGIGLLFGMIFISSCLAPYYHKKTDSYK